MLTAASGILVQGAIEIAVVGFVVILLLRMVFGSIFSVVPHRNVVLIERLGSFRRVVQAGELCVCVPGIDCMRNIEWLRDSANEKDATGESASISFVSGVHVPMYEMMLDFPAVRTLTSDNIAMCVDGVLDWHVVDPRLAVYAHNNIMGLIESGAIASMRRTVAALTSTAVASAGARVERDVLAWFAHSPEKYGVQITQFRFEQCSFYDGDVAAAHAHVAQTQLRSEARERKCAIDNRVAIANATAAAEVARVRATGESARSVVYLEKMRAAGASDDYLAQRNAIDHARALAKGRALVVVPADSMPLLDMGALTAKRAAASKRAASPRRRTAAAVPA